MKGVFVKIPVSVEMKFNSPYEMSRLIELVFSHLIQESDDEDFWRFADEIFKWLKKEDPKVVADVITMIRMADGPMASDVLGIIYSVGKNPIAGESNPFKLETIISIVNAIGEDEEYKDYTVYCALSELMAIAVDDWSDMIPEIFGELNENVVKRSMRYLASVFPSGAAELIGMLAKSEPNLIGFAEFMYEAYFDDFGD